MTSLMTALMQTEKEQEVDLAAKPQQQDKDDTDRLVVQSLRHNYELKVRCSESLSSIVERVKLSYPFYDASAVHTCVVEAFPDLQAQQSKDEIFYLGIVYTAPNTKEVEKDQVITWMKTRFQEDMFGKISTRTVLEIFEKEIGACKANSVGYYMRRAFPRVFIRRSDRLRWWCGISLPEKQLTEEEQAINIWLHSASKWLQENMCLRIGTKEQCSVVYSAIGNYVGKQGHHRYITALKTVFPSIIRKTIERIDYYMGLTFINSETRETVNSLYVPSRGKEYIERPIVNEKEQHIVDWLRKALKQNNGSREKIGNLAKMLTRMTGEHTTEKSAIKLLRKAFPMVRYRRRNAIGYLIGIEITETFKPKNVWMEKSINWYFQMNILCLRQLPNMYSDLVSGLRQVLMPATADYCEKAVNLLCYIKEAVQCANRNQCLELLRQAFPRITVKTTHDGQMLHGIKWQSEKHVEFPHFHPEDFDEDFTHVEGCSLDQSGVEDQTFDSSNADVSGNIETPIILPATETPQRSNNPNFSTPTFLLANNSINNSTNITTNITNNNSTNNSSILCSTFTSSPYTRIHPTTTIQSNIQSNTANNFGNNKLEEKVDGLTKLVENMSEEISQLRSELSQSARQKDALIVQLQQTLVLLTQQQYQRMLKPPTIPAGATTAQITPSNVTNLLNGDIPTNVGDNNNGNTKLNSLPTMTDLKQY